MATESFSSDKATWHSCRLVVLAYYDTLASGGGAASAFRNRFIVLCLKHTIRGEEFLRLPCMSRFMRGSHHKTALCHTVGGQINGRCELRRMQYAILTGAPPGGGGIERFFIFAWSRGAVPSRHYPLCRAEFIVWYLSHPNRGMPNAQLATLKWP